jgi:hypothetical protein
MRPLALHFGGPAADLERSPRPVPVILVGNQQAESLDQEFIVGPGTEVSFVRLTPLVGE